MHDKLSPSVRFLLAAAGAVSIVAGPVLFFLPRQTEAYFAWTIAHPLTPIYMGASYTSAGVGLFLSLKSNRWSVARVVLPAVIVFATSQLVATILHTGAFNWPHPVAWAWLAVYVLSMPASIVLFALTERGYQPESGGAPLGAVLPSVMLLLAAVYVVFGLLLFFLPASAIPLWPWTLTPLTSRVVGGWLLTVASLLWTGSRQRAPGAASAVLLALVVLASMALVGAVWHNREFGGPPLAMALYVTTQLGLGVLSGLAYVKQARARI